MASNSNSNAVAAAADGVPGSQLYHKQDEAEVPLSKIVSMCLNDSFWHDVTLKGGDGVLVTANRTILSIRSSVFKTMLLSGFFKEATQKVVSFNEYSGAVLQAVVEYIHSNATQLLSAIMDKGRTHDSNFSGDDDSSNDRTPDSNFSGDNYSSNDRTHDSDFSGDDDSSNADYENEKPVPAEYNDVLAGNFTPLLSLTEAAIFFHLPGLVQKTMEAARKVLDDEPHLCFRFLDSCRETGPAIPEALLEFAQARVRQSAYKHVNAEAIQGLSLSLSVVEEIASDHKLEHMSEFRVFQIIELWADEDPVSRQASASDLVKAHIALEKIGYSLLSTVVESSGLVTSDQLNAAYQTNPSTYSQYRVLPVWKNSKSTTTYLPIDTGITFDDYLARRGLRPEHPLLHENITSYLDEDLREVVVQLEDFVDCPPMLSGLHEWTIELLGDTANQRSVGIAMTGSAFKGRYGDNLCLLRYEEGFQLLRSSEYPYPYNTVRGSEAEYIGNGDKVTFTLDLRPTSQGNGTLKVSLDGSSTSHLVFSDLRQKGVTGLFLFRRGFIPAVSSSGRRQAAGFRLLDIRCLEE